MEINPTVVKATLLSRKTYMNDFLSFSVPPVLRHERWRNARPTDVCCLHFLLATSTHPTPMRQRRPSDVSPAVQSVQKAVLRIKPAIRFFNYGRFI